MSYDLYGRPTDRDTYRKHIIELRVGNPTKNIEPLKISEICKRLNITKMTVLRYTKEAIEKGEAKTNADGKLEINQDLKEQKEFKEFCDSHPITQDPIVDSWITRSKSMGHSGNGVRALNGHVHAIQRVCNELAINPIQLTIDLETSEKYAQAYLDKLVTGEIKRTSLKVKSSAQSAFYAIRMGIRHFMQYNGRNSIAIPRGYNGVLSGRIIGHGSYADIQLSDTEIIEAESYIIKKYGLDSDIYRIFFFGLESCARKEALLNAVLDWTEENDDGDITFIVKVIETKTIHIGDGKFDKVIQRKNTQESLRMAKQRGQTKLWNDKEQSKDTAYRSLLAQLKEVYTHLGKQDHYFFEHAFHALRHIGAHYWLRKTNYNYGFVAELGGWTVIDELKKSYGKMPASTKLKMLKDARKGLDQI